MRLQLTRANRAQVFAQKPHVRRAYIANVPHIMTKEQFWMKYCRWDFILQKKRKAEYLGRGPVGGLVDDDDDDEFFRRWACLFCVVWARVPWWIFSGSLFSFVWKSRQ